MSDNESKCPNSAMSDFRAGSVICGPRERRTIKTKSQGSFNTTGEERRCSCSEFLRREIVEDEKTTRKYN
jgi:hypothetical protein